MAEKQNLTVRLEKDVVRKAKILAAQRGTSISHLVATTIRRLVDEEEAFEASRQRAEALLTSPYHLGGAHPCSRDELHER